MTASKLATEQDVNELMDYIQRGWTVLERSHDEMLSALVDNKIHEHQQITPTLFISPNEDTERVLRDLEAATRPEELERIQIKDVPPDPDKIQQHGLLYLPHHYVVPGGSFNEMYGWDSYFIVLGLIADGLIPFAREMADNLVYEVNMYGKVLNANRSYYLTRSQPPFLSETILAVFDKTKDRDWLRKTLPAVEKYYEFWTQGPRFIEPYGLSRYYDSSQQPAPEVFVHERDEQGKTHFDRVKKFYREHADRVTEYELSDVYDSEADELKPLFYRADRAMRESGHDPSNRFGHFNIGVLNMLPVDLNCLLYQMELDLAIMQKECGNADQTEIWRQRAEDRATRINDLMWNQEDGWYFDYNFAAGRHRVYCYVTTLFPMWVGIASEKQAQKIVQNLPLLEVAGGLMTSTNVSGNQWDAPMGWAPMHFIAVEALRRYGYQQEADRIAIKFLSMILKEFIEHDVILEKYNVEQRESNVPQEIRYGYSSNEVGFGWTNATFLELYNQLPAAKRSAIRSL